MANNIGFGKIYDSTWWGNGVTDNSISWGIIYKDLAGSDSFVFSVKTDNAGSTLTNQFQLPLISASTVNAVVDWGDGSSDTITSYNQAETLHTYASSGEYTITMSGVINGWQFNNSGDKSKILDIINFGTFELDSTTAELQFWGCSNLVISSSDDGNYENATSFFRTWRYCSSLTSFPLIDTSSGTNFSQTWTTCNSLTSFPLLDTSSGTDFSSTWSGCSSLISFQLLDTSSGTSFIAAWHGCSSLTSFPLIDTSSGTNFSQTWKNCTSLTSFPLIDTSSGANFSSAWNGCSSLTSFPANMFDTCLATNFTSAFLNTNLSQTSIDNILVSIDTAGQSNGTFNQSGGEAPSATGEAAIDSLVGKGWTITVTGGYAGLGTELLINNSFDSGQTGWSVSAGEWTFSDGNAYLDSGNYTILSQTISQINGMVRIKVDLKVEGTSGVIIEARENGTDYRELERVNVFDGVKIYDISTFDRFRIWRTLNGVSPQLTLRSVSVKEIL